MHTVDRILATSDLHGQNKKFHKLLKTMQYEPEQDLLIVCGDLIDRGKENLKCLAACQKLQRQGAVLLKGNHEQFLEQSLIEMLETHTWRTMPSDNLYNWVTHNGGAEMYNEIKDLSAEKLTAILTWIQSLPLYFTIGKFIFTHAAANTHKPIEENTEDEVVWADESFYYHRAYKDKIMIFGHIPTWLLNKSGAENKDKNKNAKIWFDNVYKDKIDIDCGGVFGGKLAAIELPSMREFYE